MYKIIVKGEAKTEYPILSELNGISCHERFSEYFDRGKFAGVTGGYLKFVLEDEKLFSVTTYDSSRELSADELEELKEYTSGQWSDGIGEGFEQEPCHTGTVAFNKYDPKYDDYEDQDDADNDRNVYISAWFNGQVITITQEKAA